MATVIALFDDQQSITKARDELEKAGYGDDVVEVIDGGYAGTGDAAPDAVAAPAGTTGSQAGGAVVDTSSYPQGLRDSSLSSEEKDFFMQSLGDGTKMIIMDADADSDHDLETLLNEAGATRVHVD